MGDWDGHNDGQSAIEKPQSPVHLNAANLDIIRAIGAISAPLPGSRGADLYIAHIGVGNFHRSHQAYVPDQIRRKSSEDSGKSEQWGILGVGLMSLDARMHNIIKKQDCLYTLLMRSSVTSAACIIGSISDYLFVPDEASASILRPCDPDCRIISLTVTEKGYYRTADGALDSNAEFIQDDVSEWTSTGIECPKTSFGLICTVL